MLRGEEIVTHPAFVFDDDIESMHAIVENCCSSTVATALAIVSGVAPVPIDTLTKSPGASRASRNEPDDTPATRRTANASRRAR